MPLSVGEALAAALVARGGEGARVSDRVSRPWASATFSGAMHRFEVRMADVAAAAFVEGLDEAEFVLRGNFVADVVAEEIRAGGMGEAVVVVEALTVEEG